MKWEVIQVFLPVIIPDSLCDSCLIQHRWYNHSRKKTSNNYVFSYTVKYLKAVILCIFQTKNFLKWSISHNMLDLPRNRKKSTPI